MRIHLPLHSSQFSIPSAAGPSTPPLVQLGGDLVLVELQGELSYEGERDDGVIGVIGLDRPEKPTLHLGPHHLLHGKFVNLQKPYAVIRRVVGDPTATEGVALDGDARAEESGSEDGNDDDDDDEEEEDEELFEPNPDFPRTPQRSGYAGKSGRAPMSSSPISIPATPLDYSSELDMSSPARSDVDSFGFPRSRAHSDSGSDEDGGDGDNTRAGRAGRLVKRRKIDDGRGGGVAPKKKRKTTDIPGRERTRHYEVVGVVRRKVVFALRPEPLVAPTELPE